MPLSAINPKMLRAHKHILRPAKKIGVVVLILVQFVRLFGIGATMYFIYNAIGSDQGQIGSFDQLQPMDGYNDTNTAPGTNEDTPNLVASDDSEGSDADIKDDTFQEWLLFFVPIVEILISLVITALVMGPLSPLVTIQRWIMWLFKMRMFWMRFVWTLTGATYAVLYVQNRKLLHQQTGESKFLDSDLVKVSLALTALEYGCLGMVESIVKLVKVETIENRLRKHDSSIRGFWKNACMFGYYMCLLAYALRSFTMSLYFGILSVISNDDDQISSDQPIVLPPGMNNLNHDETIQAENDIRRQLKLHGAIVVVLQIYLAIIRGKFYGFFMHNFLSHFLYEADHEYFQADLNAEMGPETNQRCRESILLSGEITSDERSGNGECV